MGRVSYISLLLHTPCIYTTQYTHVSEQSVVRAVCIYTCSMTCIERTHEYFQLKIFNARCLQCIITINKYKPIHLFHTLWRIFWYLFELFYALFLNMDVWLLFCNFKSKSFNQFKWPCDSMNAKLDFYSYSQIDCHRLDNLFGYSKLCNF